jgi:PGF-CTERM protein
MIAQENGFIPVSEIAVAEITEEAAPVAEQAEQREEAPAQSQPGFEVILALVSLLAVTYFVAGGRRS